MLYCLPVDWKIKYFGRGMKVMKNQMVDFYCKIVEVRLWLLPFQCVFCSLQDHCSLFILAYVQIR